MLLAERGKVGEIYNAGPSYPVSIRHLVEMCAECVGAPFEQVVEVVPDRTGQDRCYWLDSEKLRALGWDVKVPLQDAVASVYQWVREHLEVLAQQPHEYELRA